MSDVSQTVNGSAPSRRGCRRQAVGRVVAGLSSRYTAIRLQRFGIRGQDEPRYRTLSRLAPGKIVVAPALGQCSAWAIRGRGLQMSQGDSIKRVHAQSWRPKSSVSSRRRLHRPKFADWLPASASVSCSGARSPASQSVHRRRVESHLPAIKLFGAGLGH
jgi:hypothetical protein